VACRLTVTVRAAHDSSEIKAAQDLRLQVFCEEQGVTREEELDGLDEHSTHIVALDESGVIATCRLRYPDPGTCKLERMVVERRLRGTGVGGRLLGGAESEAREQGASTMLVHAQRRAEPFYASKGYLAEGETFMSARIKHVRMRKAL
jgi:predicted GNAT family N-acyltransferase